MASSPTSSESTGYVTAVEGQEFTIGTGTSAIRVDTSNLVASKKPAVKVGDRVYAWGDLDLDPQERTETMAKELSLAKDRTKISGRGTSGGDNSGTTGAATNQITQANSAATQP